MGLADNLLTPSFSLKIHRPWYIKNYVSSRQTTTFWPGLLRAEFHGVIRMKRTYLRITFSLFFGLLLAACNSAEQTRSAAGDAPTNTTGNQNPGGGTTTYTLAVSTNGSGTVTSNTGGINCGTACSATYNSGSSVTLTASADNGYSFTAWGGSCSGTGTCTVAMNNTRSVTATFTQNTTTPSSYLLTVTKVGSGTVTSNTGGINCGTACSATYNSGSSVTLTASAATGYIFSGWTANGCSGVGTCTLTMNANQSPTATFAPVTAGGNYNLNLGVFGDGEVARSPSGTSCGTNCYRYSAGDVVTLTPTANSGASHIAWIGEGQSCAAGAACTITMSSNRSIVSSFHNPSKNLCGNLPVQNSTAVYRRTNIAKPALLGSYVDPNFGTTIRRITDVATQGQGSSVIKPMYATMQAWNADESYMIFYRVGGTDGSQHLLYNGRTYQYIKVLDINPADLETVFWHSSDPDILFYPERTSRSLIRYRISTGAKETLRTFGGNCRSDLINGTDPMYMSWDSDVIGLNCNYSAGGTLENFAYRVSTNTESTHVVTAQDRNAAPQPGPSGKYFYYNESDNSSGRRNSVRDFNMTSLRTLDLDSAHEHATLGLLPNGQDAYFGIQFEVAPGGTQNGSIVMHNMVTGGSRSIVGPSRGYPYPPSGTHLSAQSFHNAGWVAASIVGSEANGQSLLDNELVLAYASASGTADRICRIGHHHSCGGAGCGAQGYWAEPHLVLSPKGTRVLFGSDWRGGSTVDSYVVELPGYTP
jgi:hypothetical protein